MAGIQLLLSQW